MPSSIKDITSDVLWDLEGIAIGAYIKRFNYPWEALPGLKDFILDLGQSLDKTQYKQLGEDIWVEQTAILDPSASITGPCIIGAHSEIRHNAYIRGSVYIGSHSVIGNASEVKNAILLDHVEVPHFNYVGDSILGHYSHLGAGAITSNVRGDKKTVTVKAGEEVLDTGLRKFGALLGDRVEIGCQTVINPGSVIGKDSRIYPLVLLRGVIPAKSLVKSDGVVVAIREEH